MYRLRHGTPCPPLLPPRRPLAKREQRRECSFTRRSFSLSLQATAIRKKSARLSRPFSHEAPRDRSLLSATLLEVRGRECACPGSPARWLESGTLRAPRCLSCVVGAESSTRSIGFFVVKNEESPIALALACVTLCVRGRRSSREERLG